MTTDCQEHNDRFEQDLAHAFQSVRGAFTQLLTSVRADASRPQDLARRFGLNKNLAWKVAKIVAATEPHAALPNVPGASGVEILLRAFAAGGAPPNAVEAAREAMNRFDDVVASHVGDRSTLRLVLSSKTPEKVPPEFVESTRKMAFQGNSCIWGLQCRVRLASHFIAPNPDDPTLIDAVSLGGLIDVRRLRPNASVPLFMRFAYNDDGTPRSGPAPQPIDPDCDPEDELMLVRRYCSDPLPEFCSTQCDTYVRYHLAPGPVGNTGLQTWVYGEFTRGFASIYRDQVNMVGEHVAPVHMPTEWLLCDLLVHRQFAFAHDPRALLYSQLNGGPSPSDNTDGDRLPLTEPVQEIGRRPPVVATPLVPRYAEMVQRVYDRLGWKADDFHGYRVVMKYPPMPAAMIFQHGLASR